MKKNISIFLLFISFTFSGFSQRFNSELKESFLAAESYFLFEEYAEALPLYLKLHRAFPDNNNFNYKIGVCYLNNPYEKDKSIYYLEKTINDINPDFKDNSFRETTAPLEALFYLGNAYRINNELGKARQYYDEFLKLVDPEIYDTVLVMDQLENCDVAEKLMKKPVDFDMVNMGELINTRFADNNPVLSGDETKMAFISKLQFYDAVFYTEKVDNKWSVPRNIIPELGVDGDVYPTSLSFDGKEMFVYRNDGFIGSIYSTNLVEGKWAPLVILNENINTKYWESHASISKDGNILYFTSNRKGGFGGLDIYYSNRSENGDWGPAINLGSNINTKYNEETPMITADGKKIFFSSYGHYNMGGYDIFMSIRENDTTWSNPVNLGYPLNSTDDDLFFNPVKNGMFAYYSIFNDKGFGRHDIYRYVVYNADHPRKYTISGKLNAFGESISDLNISIVETLKGDTINRIKPDIDGKFQFEVPTGNYELVFDSDKFEKLTQSLSVVTTTPHSGIELKNDIKLKLLPLPLTPTEIDQLLEIKDSVLIVNNDSLVVIKFNAEKGSEVIIHHYYNSEIVSSDTIKEIDQQRQEYLFQPKPGINEIVITLTDDKGNKVTKSVSVIYENIIDSVNDSIIEDKTDNSEFRVEDLRQHLINKADGQLKNFLVNLDLDKAGIEDSEELMKYLYRATEIAGFTKQDVDNLTQNTITQKNKEQFLSSLLNNSDGKLKETVAGLNLDSLNINTPYELSQYLIKEYRKYGYKTEDVLKALAKAGSNEKNLQTYISKLAGSAESGSLKDYILSTDFSKLNVTTPEDLAIFLYKKAGIKSFNKADVIKALTYAAINKDAQSLKDELSGNATGSLKDYLDNLDLEKEGIFTADQLINHLYNVANKQNFSGKEINDLLKQYSTNNITETENFRLKLAQFSSGNLKEFLDTMDIRKYNIITEDDLINYLQENSSKLGFTIQDVKSALLKLAMNGSLEEEFNQLKENSSGKLHTFLKKTDLNKEGIYSYEDLINYLYENADKNGYIKEDVSQLVQQNMEKKSYQDFIDRMKQFATGNLKAFLDTLNVQNLNIKSVDGLIEYLIAQSVINGYDINDIWNTIQQMAITKSDKSDNIPATSSKVQPDISKSIIYTLAVLIGLICIIFFIIWFERKKKKEKK